MKVKCFHLKEYDTFKEQRQKWKMDKPFDQYHVLFLEGFFARFFLTNSSSAIPKTHSSPFWGFTPAYLSKSFLTHAKTVSINSLSTLLNFMKYQHLLTLANSYSCLLDSVTMSIPYVVWTSFYTSWYSSNIYSKLGGKNHSIWHAISSQHILCIDKGSM